MLRPLSLLIDLNGLVVGQRRFLASGAAGAAALLLLLSDAGRYYLAAGLMWIINSFSLSLSLSLIIVIVIFAQLTAQCSRLL